jgi:hypothetical protein
MSDRGVHTLARRFGALCGLVVGAVVLGKSPDARASSCPAPQDAPALAGTNAEARIAFLESAFDREIAEVDLWSWTWGSIYAGAAVAQVVVIPLVHDYGTHVDLAVGAVSAGIGSVSLFGLPLEITLPLRAARLHGDDTQPCRLLAELEATLVRVERQQQLSTGWVPHAGNVAFNAALALVLGWGFGRWPSAAISAGIGTAVGETNILTQPHHLSRVLELYRGGLLDAPVAPVSWSVAPLPVRGAAGVSFGIAF